ncbi:hypothetical protein RJ640_025309 [Escallonia rubra]|uniref:Uncharacterized protein n=1 Tax=Escallonia rubra TaxID=112253 RepID=A0AA88QTQ6_9ASTE|nr:hypothetical protein RJ640_025309 [Escallonia rubra]
MRIAEISSPDLRPSLHDPRPHALSQIQLSLEELERHPPGTPVRPPRAADLRHSPTQLSSIATPFSNSDKLQVWKLSYRLWNSCVDLSNAAAVHSSSSDSGHRNISDEQHAFIRHVAADLLVLAADVSGMP